MPPALKLRLNGSILRCKSHQGCAEPVGCGYIYTVDGGCYPIADSSERASLRMAGLYCCCMYLVRPGATTKGRAGFTPSLPREGTGSALRSHRVPVPKAPGFILVQRRKTRELLAVFVDLLCLKLFGSYTKRVWLHRCSASRRAISIASRTARMGR